MLSFLAYKEMPLDVLLFLQRVSKESSFRSISPPKHNNFQVNDGYSYSSRTVESILHKHFYSLERFRTSNKSLLEDKEYDHVKKMYDSIMTNNLRSYEKRVETFWNSNKNSSFFEEIFIFIFQIK